MGAWGKDPWDNDSAADWFADVFDGIDIDSKIEQALSDSDNYDEVRAAAYLLDVLGSAYIWPGDLDKYDDYVKQIIAMLEAMIDENSDDPDMDFLELWDNDPEIIQSVKQQINNLQKRLS